MKHQAEFNNTDPQPEPGQGSWLTQRLDRLFPAPAPGLLYQGYHGDAHRSDTAHGQCTDMSTDVIFIE